MLKWYNNNKREIDNVKKHLWMPKDENDYQNLNVKVIPVENYWNHKYKETLVGITTTSLYDDIVGQDWSYVREKYLNGVG